MFKSEICNEQFYLFIYRLFILVRLYDGIGESLRRGSGKERKGLCMRGREWKGKERKGLCMRGREWEG